MNTLHFRALAVVAAVVALAGRGLAAEFPSNCGVTAVAGWSEAAAKPLSMERVRAMSERWTAPEVSLGDVRDMAASLGQTLSAFSATAAELASRRAAAIVHLRAPDHFATLVGLDAKWAQLLDGWQPRLVVLPRTAFDERYTGRCLVDPDVAKQPGAPEIAVQERHVQFGTGEAGRDVQATFRIANRGGHELQLRFVRSSCSCTTPGKSDLAIDPGASADLPVSLRASAGRGILQYVAVRSNDPACPVIFLSVGIDDVPLGISVVPAALTVSAKSPQWRTATLRLTGPADLHIVALEAEPECVTPRLKQRSADGAQATYQISVTINPGLTSGIRSGRILVHTGLGKDDVVPVPFTAVVPEVVVAEPARIADLRVKPGLWEGTVRVDLADPATAAKVTGADIEGLTVGVDGVRSVGATRWLVDLSGKVAKGIYRGRLVIHLNSPVQPELVVPITLAVDQAALR